MGSIIKKILPIHRSERNSAQKKDKTQKVPNKLVRSHFGGRYFAQVVPF